VNNAVIILLARLQDSQRQQYSSSNDLVVKRKQLLRLHDAERVYAEKLKTNIDTVQVNFRTFLPNE